MALEQRQTTESAAFRPRYLGTKAPVTITPERVAS